MKELIFWNKWTTQTRVLYWICLFVFFASIAFLTTYYLIGLESVLDWSVAYDIQSVEVAIDHVRHKVFDLPINSDEFVVFQYFKASLIKDNVISAAIYVGILAFGACLGLAVITTYKNLIWFAVGSSVFVLWLSFLKLDLLGVFGFYNNYLLGAMLVVYLGLAYLFHSWTTNVSFLKRFLSFLLATVVFGLVIFKFSAVQSPIIHLASFGVMVPAIILLMYLFIIGYEVGQFMLSIMTMSRNSNPWSVPLNFLIITVYYVANNVLYYLYYTKQIDWKLPYNIYLFFPLCAVLGIWSHRKRSVLYTKILPFAPGGAFLFMSISIVSIATLGYVTSIGLAPAIKVFEMLFVISQAAYGIAFFAYAIRNFYKPMTVNMPISKMIFDPRLMPHYVLRGLGVVMMGFFIGRESQGIQSNIKSSYYTLKGNWYKSTEEDLVAKENYKTALEFSIGGHLASYSLASLYLKEGDFARAIEVLENVNNYEASEYLYATLSAAYQNSEDKMKQILLLQDAVKMFPNSSHIANNIGLAYYKLGYADSAVFYLQKAIESNQSNVINANILGVAAIRKLGGEEEIELNKEFISDIPYMANAYALANVLGAKVNYEYDLSKTPDDADGVSLSLYSNYLDYHLQEAPKELIEKLDQWNSASGVLSNVDNTRLVYGKALFYNGDIKKGLDQMNRLTKYAGTYQKPYFNNISALLHIKAGLFEDAYRLLFEADQMLQLSQNNFVRENCAIMALEVGDFEYAQDILPPLAISKPLKKQQYLSIYNALKGSTDSSEYQKAIEVLFLKEIESKDFLAELAKFSKGKLKNVLVLDLLEKAIALKRTNLVDSLWALVPNELDDKEQFHQINLLNLKTLDMRGDFNQLAEVMPKLELAAFENRWKTYFGAHLAEREGDTSKTKILYEESLKLFPKKENVCLDYIEFLSQIGKHKEAYEICAEYLRENSSTKQMLLEFVKVCVAINLFIYSDSTVEELKQYMTAEEYSEYRKSYEEATKVNDIELDLVQ